MTTLDTPRLSGGTRPVPWTLAALSLCMLMSSLDTSITNVALPTFARAFGATFQQVQWIVLAYLLAVTTLIVSVGRLGDLAGRRRLLQGGIVVFTLASAICAIAPALWLLIAARAAQGIGAAIMTALALAFVGDAVPKENTGSAMGLLGTMSAVGTALGPSLGGMLIATAGWRWLFIINVPIGIATSMLASRHLPADRPKSARVQFDVRGTLLLAATLAAYALAMTVAHRRLLLLSIAAAGVALFITVERRAASPLVRLALFRNRVSSAGFAMTTIVMTVVMSTLVVGPFYLSRTLALDAARVGLVMSCGPIVSALTGVPAGRVVDRIGTGRTAIAGLLAILTGSLIFSIAPAALGVAGYVAPLVVITSGYALFQAANNTSIMTSVRDDERGVVSGVLSLSRNLGLITGASMMGAVFVAGGLHGTFAVAAGLVAIAIAIAWRKT